MTRREDFILGSTGSLECLKPPSVSNKIKSVLWFYNKKQLKSDSSKYFIDKNILKINKLDLRDRGVYNCKLKYINASIITNDKIDLDILYPPVILKSPSTNPVLKGHDLSLNCSADGNPPIKYEWLKEKMITEFIRAKVKLSENTNSLVIRNMSNEDEGRYFCKVSNQLGSKETSVDVKILVPPSVKLTPSSPMVTEGSSLHLKCEASGLPAPQISWITHDYIMPNDFSWKSQPGMSLWTLSRARRTHSGTVSCFASNEAGNFSQNASIRVLYKPEVTLKPNETKVWPGMSLVLTCDVMASPLPREVTWFLNNNPFPLSNPNVSSSNSIISKETLVGKLIVRIENDDEGENNFSCLAQNDIGVAKATSLVVMEDLPSQPEVDFIDENSDHVRLMMKAEDQGTSNHPLPLLYWKVMIQNMDNKKQDTIIFPYSSEIFLSNLTSGSKFNLSLLVSNYVGYSSPLTLEVSTSINKQNLLADKNASLFRRETLKKTKLSSMGGVKKKIKNKKNEKEEEEEEEEEGVGLSGLGFMVTIGVGSLLVLIIIFTLSGLIIFWQKKALEKSKLLEKTPSHNVVATLTRLDLESQRALGKPGQEPEEGTSAQITRDKSRDRFPTPIGYFKGDSVDDVIDHLNSSFYNK